MLWGFELTDSGGGGNRLKSHVMLGVLIRWVSSYMLGPNFDAPSADGSTPVEHGTGLGV